MPSHSFRESSGAPLVEHMTRRVSLIVPCFNEAGRLNSAAFLAAAGQGLRLLLVDDGSSDGTLSLLEELASKSANISVLGLRENVGKAQAVRAGMLRALEVWPDAEWVGFWDADMSTPLSEIPSMLSYAAAAQGICDAVWCSRIKRAGSRIERHFHRHLFGRLFATAAGILLGVEAYDTQCGAKLFRREVVGEVFTEPFLSRWIFDVEIYLRLGHDRIVEYPMLMWRDVPGSKVKIGRESGRVLADLLRLRRKYGAGKMEV